MPKTCERCKKGFKRNKRFEAKYYFLDGDEARQFVLCDECLKKLNNWFLIGERERYWEEINGKQRRFCKKYIVSQCVGCPIKQYKVSNQIVMACNQFTEKYPEVVRGLKESSEEKKAEPKKVNSSDKSKRKYYKKGGDKNYDRGKKIHL